MSNRAFTITQDGTSRTFSIATGVGPAGAPGATDYNELDNVPSTFTPSSHASSHATGGSDAITPTSIGAANTTHTHVIADITGLDITQDDFDETFTAGNINTSGSTNGAGGSITTSDNGGSINTGATGGSINTSGDGGSIDTSAEGGHINTSSTGGNINTSDSGGYIFTFTNGGNIDTSDGGGSITTAFGGGSIDTTGLGAIELGSSGTRTTVTGTATADRAISLPDAPGTLLISSLNLSGLSDAAAARTNLGGGTVGQSLFTSATIANARSALQQQVLQPSANMSMTANATSTNISGMSFSVDANSTYQVAYHGEYNAGAGGSNVDLSLPSITYNGPGVFFGVRCPATGTLAGVATTSALVIRVDRNTIAHTGNTFSSFIFTTGVSGGTANFQFAQANSNGAASTILTGTKAIITKI